MVHRKSTYRLMFKNYDSQLRKNVWQENKILRLRRRVDEMSHHSIEESDSDCICDELDDEEKVKSSGRHPEKTPIVGTRGMQDIPNDQVQQSHLSTQDEQKNHPLQVPRLRFSPEQSPRAPQQQSTPHDMDTNFIRNGTSEKFNDRRGSMPDLNITQDTVESQRVMSEHRSKSRLSGEQVGVMRPGSGVREYDLIPATSDGAQKRGAALTRSGLRRSHMYPLTSQLSRTTRRNFEERDKVNYVSYGTGSDVRTIGDKTSFNIHLNKDQVQPTSLHASSLRNREIEQLIKKQRKMTLDDWIEKRETVQPINHSSLWADGRREIFSSRTRPRQRLKSAPSRVEVFSNYCRHCGGKK